MSRGSRSFYSERDVDQVDPPYLTFGCETSIMSRGSPRPPQSIFYVDLIDSKGRRCEVQISDDTGTPDNWIHPYIVSQYRLTSKKLHERIEYRDASGNPLFADRFVILEWIGEDNQQFREQFYIGSEKASIPRLILGDRFVTEHGRAVEICRLDPRVRDVKILTQTQITDVEATKIRANGEKAVAESARLERNREIDSSRRKYSSSSTRKYSSSTRAYSSSTRNYSSSTRKDNSSSRQTPTVREDAQYVNPPVDDNDTYDSPVINPPDDHYDTFGSSGINWGPWERLPNGQWHREGQDSLGNWYEDNRDQDPR